MATAEKIVPPRNELKKVEVYAVSRAYELAGKDPNYEYFYASADERHPQYVGKYLQRQEIGDPAAGYALVEPWEVVHSKEVTQGRARDDQGKPIDTSVRNGDTILIKTSKANYAAYEEIERRRDAGNAKRLRSDRATLRGDAGGVATHTFQTSSDPNVQPQDLLQQAEG